LHTVEHIAGLGRRECPGRRGERQEEGFALYLAPFHRNSIARRRRAAIAQGIHLPRPQRPED